MKFKKEDVGLYLAASLAGGGLGLLVGALIASRLTEPIVIPEEEEYDIEIPENLEPGDSFDISVEKIAGEKKSRKKTIKFKPEDDPEIAAFIAEWEPSPIQIEMLKTERVTPEELIQVILEERAKEESAQYNYSAPYYDKPELFELGTLPEDEEVIDDRYQILQDPPVGKSTKSVRVILYDSEDESFYSRSRNSKLVPRTLKGTISDETWIILKSYFEKGYQILYVDDLETTRWFRFELLVDDLEDSSPNGSDSK